MSIAYHQIGRVDIHRGEHVIATYIGEQAILSRHRGGDWIVAEGTDLGDLILAASALLEFEGAQR